MAKPHSLIFLLFEKYNQNPISCNMYVLYDERPILVQTSQTSPQIVQFFELETGFFQESLPENSPTHSKSSPFSFLRRNATEQDIFIGGELVGDPAGKCVEMK